MTLLWHMMWLLPLVTLLAGSGIAAFRVLALRHGWVAPVSERSSHRAPVPTGAGLVMGLVLTPVLACLSLILGEIWLWLAALAFCLTILGWLDDRFELPVGLRLGVQGLVCLLWLWSAWPSSELTWALAALVGLWIVGQLWFINLFNFMDGLDGFAASEALFVFLSLIWLMPDQALLPWLAGLAAAAVLALLYWNRPPARVFMGDAGSLLLGFLLSAPVLWMSPSEMAIWLILVAAFVADASLTLLWRFFQGHRLTQAHRLHVYQRLAVSGHGRVVGGLWIINLFWLLPWAALVAFGHVSAGLALSLAYAGLLLVWLRARTRFRTDRLESVAGMQENRQASENGQ